MLETKVKRRQGKSQKNSQKDCLNKKERKTTKHFFKNLQNGLGI